MTDTISIRADWLWTGSGLPIPNGTVSCQVNSRMVPADLTLPKQIDLGRVCLLPGLINSHTHLEFSNFEQPIPQRSSFVDWLSDVVSYRRGGANRSETNPLSPDVGQAAATEKGLDESLRSGVQFMLDVVHPHAPSIKKREQESSRFATEPVPDELLQLKCEFTHFVSRHRLQFQELLATTRQRALETWRHALSNHNRSECARGVDCYCRYASGLSPHAPYTTVPKLIRKAALRCRRLGSPIMMHLAESPDEVRWLQRGDGKLDEFLREVVGSDYIPVHERRTMAEYIQLLSIAPTAFVVHGNYLDDPSLSLLASLSRHVGVVFCPRTHQHFQHCPFPLPEMLEQGISVVLGTDSRASNPDLSVLEEARCVRRMYPDINAHTIMSMITTEPMRLLRWSYPTLAVGYSVVPCVENDPLQVLDTILEDSQPAVNLESLVSVHGS